MCCQDLLLNPSGQFDASFLGNKNIDRNIGWAYKIIKVLDALDLQLERTEEIRCSTTESDLLLTPLLGYCQHLQVSRTCQ